MRLLGFALVGLSMSGGVDSLPHKPALLLLLIAGAVLLAFVPLKKVTSKKYKEKNKPKIRKAKRELTDNDCRKST